MTPTIWFNYSKIYFLRGGFRLGYLQVDRFFLKLTALFGVVSAGPGMSVNQHCYWITDYSFNSFKRRLKISHFITLRFSL